MAFNLISNSPVNPVQKPAPPNAVKAANTPAWKCDGLGKKQARSKAMTRPAAPNRNPTLAFRNEVGGANAVFGIGVSNPHFSSS